MRRTLFPLILAAVLVLPSVAHADTIDDFLFTGTDSTISFSLPASPANPEVIRGRFNDAGFHVGAVVTIDGVTYPDAGLQFLTVYSGAGTGVSLFLTNNYSFTLVGDQLFTGPSAAPTFKTGTFPLTGFFAPDFRYDLTITPESAPPDVPESSTCLLLAIGLLSLPIFAIRRGRHAVPIMQT